jgi:hypothetical protein
MGALVRRLERWEPSLVERAMDRGHFAGLFLVLFAFAACGDDAGGSGDDSGARAGAASGAGAVSGTEGGGGEGGALVPYAHVVGVSVSGEPMSYSFAVTVESADIDCSQYADWWEVLDESGSLVYRRILEHSHTDENGTTDADAPANTFTRSGGPVAIAADDIVIVRAHMSVGGYNGLVLRGTATEGFYEATDIDSSFASGVEDEPPLPAGCLF